MQNSDNDVAQIWQVIDAGWLILQKQNYLSHLKTCDYENSEKAVAEF